MAMKRNWILAAVGLGLGGSAFWSEPGLAQTVQDPGLLVVYGRNAEAREGDVDRREQVFFSVPADLKDRIYVRIFDPEIKGENDFVYGSGADSETTFRLFGGEGAFSAADRPVAVEDGAQEPRLIDLQPVTGPGVLIGENTWGGSEGTDGRWANLTTLRASQGEVVNGRAYFRLDVQGTNGNDGNGFSVGISLSRDRNRAPAGLEMFSYSPTIRWQSPQSPTDLWFTNPGGALTVQSYDGAAGKLALVTDFEDLDIEISGQSHWTSDTVQSADEKLALRMSGGFESPNDVTLSVFDKDGAPVPLQIPPMRALNPLRPTAVGTASPLADCRSVAFDASGSTARIPHGYLWDFGDGNSATEPVIAHRYEEPGRYTARLEVVENGARPGRGSAIEVPVHVRNAPVAKPGDDIVVAPGQQVGFDGAASVASDSPIMRYKWSFGDGATAEGPQAQHVYGAPGQYRAILRVEDDSQHPCDFGVQTRNVTVNFPPVAEAGTDQIAVVGTPVMFDGAASYDIDGEVSEYSWDMGDGTVLAGPRVSHTYEGSGNFTVTLTVTDASGVANNIATDQLLISVNAPPVPEFSIPDRPVSVSEVAILDATGSTDEDGQILSYSWDFGDGVTGEGPVANYAWTKPGTFTVTLTVTDNSGTSSAVQSTQREIRVDAAPIADAGPDQMVTASVVQFDGGASSDPDGQVTEWVWDFGDGSTATGQTVSHAYLRSGVYEVAVVVRDDSGAPLNTDRDTMMVTVNATPIADAGPAQIVAPGEEFTLSGRASVDPDGKIASYVWSFPDGTEATGERVGHRIDKPGLYRIGLTAGDNFAGGAASDRSEVLITVNASPVATAGADHLVAPGDLVRFDAGQSFDPDGEIIEYRWEFEDLGSPLTASTVERAYDTPGVWSAQLIVTDNSGVANATATDDVTIRVNHAPVAEAGDPQITDSLYVELDATGSSDADGDALIYQWDLGDGSAPVFGAKVSHAYPRSGIFPVTLRVDDGTGLSNASAIDATTVTIRKRPIAEAGGNRDVCSGEPILFDASNSVNPDGGLLSYTWDFGDGSQSDLVNPSKTYEQPGAYSVTLRVRNETGTEHGTDVDRIAALVREGPIADAGPDMTVCSNQEVRFDGSGSTDADGAVNAFSWTFGDSSTGSGESPAHIYTHPGTYQVNLTITGEAVGNCSPLDSDMMLVQVLPAPILNMDGPERIGSGSEASFAAEISGSDKGELGEVRWDFGDGSSANGASASHVYDAPGDYLITLSANLVGGTEGCDQLEIMRKITVNAAPEPVITAPVEIAVGEAITFDAAQSSDSDGVVISHGWDFGDGTQTSGVAAVHQFATPGDYTVRLTVMDDAGVENSIVTTELAVKVQPAPVAALAAPVGVCPGKPVQWAVDVPDTTSVDWMFDGQAGQSGASVSHVFGNPGLFPVQVDMDDGKGLLSSRRSEEVYVRVNDMPTALAGPDRIVCPGQEVTFDAGGSADLDGKLVKYLWTFSDGVTVEGKQITRVFDAAGDLTVELAVQDDSQATGCDIGTDTARVLVNAPPTVDAGEDRSVLIGAAHDVERFIAQGITDPDGQGVRINWDFGDGAMATGANVTHRFTQSGTFTVTAEARDSTGLACGVSTDSFTLIANPRE